MKRVLLTGMALVIATVVGCAASAENSSTFDVQRIYEGSRFPNIVATSDGTLLAFRAQRHPIEVRRSEDGGQTWGQIIEVGGDDETMMGAAVVDEARGDVLVFDHFRQNRAMYRSSDDGRTWSREQPRIEPDLTGQDGLTHGSESGITLRHGEHAGRLIIPARIHGPERSNDRHWWPYHYTTAIYSDDGGESWHTSDPFPVLGTGESMLAELADGTIYYNTRSHTATDAMRRVGYSKDGGQSWVNPRHEPALPDGPRADPYGLMAGLTRVEHDDYDLLVYSNADTDTSHRERITVWLSADGGQTWPVKRLVHEGPAAYSSLAAGREGTASEGVIFLMFEGGQDQMYEGLKVARFDLAWLLDGRDLEEVAQGR